MSIHYIRGRVKQTNLNNTLGYMEEANKEGADLIFILGMITAFSECVAKEAEKAAFSPPFYPNDYLSILDETTLNS